MPFAEVGLIEDTNVNKLVVRFNGVPNNIEEVKTYLEDVGKVYNLARPILILYDTRNIGITLQKEYLDAQVEFMRSKDTLTKQLVRAVAIVVPNNIVKKLVQGLFILKKPACLVEIFSDMVEAQKFLKNHNY